VTNLDLDRHLPAARGLARRKARAVIGRCGLTPEDREDVEAQLLLALCLRFGKFDVRRSSLKTFTCRVMDREVASILRHRLAQRRIQLSRPELIEDNGSEHVFGALPSTVQRQEFWMDVAKITSTFPAPLRETVLALRCGSPSEAGEALGTARSVVYDRIVQIRRAFLAAGIGPAYFSPGGGRWSRPRTFPSNESRKIPGDLI
jgi:DNA-directed RNA polymerase specialized sigma24 family protein